LIVRFVTIFVPPSRSYREPAGGLRADLAAEEEPWQGGSESFKGRRQLKPDKKEAARELLAETHGWFTEGFDIPDLPEAKALLDELS
jgi:hypothetical protein